jgi:hypothetical protein
LFNLFNNKKKRIKENIDKLQKILKEYKVKIVFTYSPSSLLGPYSKSIIACDWKLHLVEEPPKEVWERFLQYFGIDSKPDVIYVDYNKSKYKITLLKENEVEEFLVNQCSQLLHKNHQYS